MESQWNAVEASPYITAPPQVAPPGTDFARGFHETTAGLSCAPEAAFQASGSPLAHESTLLLLLLSNNLLQLQHLIKAGDSGRLATDR